MKIMQLTCLNAADPLPKLGRKVEAPKPISAEEKRALEIAAFEACPAEPPTVETSYTISGHVSGGKLYVFEDSITSRHFVKGNGVTLKAPHDGTGYIESETVTFADVGEAATWIAWAGIGEPPAFGRVDIRFRDGSEYKDKDRRVLRWSHYGSGGDIVAYRPVAALEALQ